MAGVLDALAEFASLPVRGAWIEIVSGAHQAGLRASLPVRGAWIEILTPTLCFMPNAVAPRAGSVD